MPDIVVEGGNITLTYPKDLLLEGIAYRVEYSTDLAAWFTAGETLVSSVNYAELRKPNVTMPPNLRLFMRFTVEN